MLVQAEWQIWGSRTPHAGGGDKGHVGVGPELGEDALLAVAAAKLVADDRVAVVAHAHVHALQLCLLCPHCRHLMTIASHQPTLTPAGARY